MTSTPCAPGSPVQEFELDLEHRATDGRSRGFLHRAASSRDFARAVVGAEGSLGAR